jgi:hypothetical protein
MSNNKQSSVETYNRLTFVQKVEYKTYCENKFGSTFIEGEHGEPLFFSKDGQIISTQIIVDLLFNTNNN